MFYRVLVRDHVRVAPSLFGSSKDDAIIETLKKQFEGYISKELGIVVGISELKEVREGVIIPGDGSVFYDCDFELLAFRPELQEVVLGKVRDIADFGAFISLGVMDGMTHISQTMDDFVSFSKDKVLVGKDSKRTLKVDDLCRARIIAVSYKDVANPKLGLTMRQLGLGKLEWVDEDLNKQEKEEKPEKAEKTEKPQKKAAEYKGRPKKK